MSDIPNITLLACPKCGQTTTEDELIRMNGNIRCFTCYPGEFRPKSNKRRFAFQAINLTKAGKLDVQVQHYHGRWFYEGPAMSVSRVHVTEVQQRLKRCHLPFQVDNLGLDFIYYAG